MKVAFLNLLLGSLAVASPLGLAGVKEYARDLEQRADVNAETLADFQFYVQHAAASYCNVGSPSGAPIACSDNICSSLSTSNIVASFSGSKTGIAGYVSTDHTRREIVLAVRGSDNIQNFIADVKFFWNDCPFVKECKVHRGFDQSWAEITESAMEAVRSEKAKNPDYKIVATGHSLGGAVATLGAVFLRQEGYTVDIYSFGCPRVGNNHFANFVTNSGGAEWRLTHGKDPVPRLPPLIFGYRHTSPEYWLSKNVDTPDYPLDDIKVCEGIANLRCNGGTLGLDIEAHSDYFIPVSDCEPVHLGGLSSAPAMSKANFVTTSMVKTTDVEDRKTLEDRLNRWVKEDIEYAKQL